MPEIEERIRIHREAELRPVTRAEGDEAQAITELDIVVATSAPVRVYGVDEVLPMTNKACDLSRFRAGRAPFLADHRNSVHSILGRITKPRFENGERLVATVELADTEQARAYASLVAQGMAGSISVGFSVERWKRTDTDEAPVYTAVRWTPLEASAVAVPADNDAKITGSREIRWRTEMPNETQEPAAEQQSTQRESTATMGDQETRIANSRAAPEAVSYTHLTLPTTPYV